MIFIDRKNNNTMASNVRHFLSVHKRTILQSVTIGGVYLASVLPPRMFLKSKLMFETLRRDVDGEQNLEIVKMSDGLIDLRNEVRLFRSPENFR